MLSNVDLATMRATLEQSLPDTAAIQRRTLIPDGTLGFTETWTTVATVPCRVAPARNDEIDAAGVARTGRAQVWAIVLPANTDVLRADRVQVGSLSIEVVAVLGPRSYELGRRILGAEVDA